MFRGMAEGWYRLFWRECGTNGLTIQQKVKVLRKLTELSLRTPYFLMAETDKLPNKKTLTDTFPELVPQNLCKKHIHLTTLSGLLLYVIHTEIFKELKQLAEQGKLSEEQIKLMGDF